MLSVTDVREVDSDKTCVAGITTSTPVIVETLFDLLGRKPTSSLLSTVFTVAGTASTTFDISEAGAFAFFLGERMLPIVYAL